MNIVNVGGLVALIGFAGVVVVSCARAENQSYGTLRLSLGAIVCLTAPADLKTDSGAVDLPKGSCLTIRPDDPPKPVEAVKPAEPVCPAPVKANR